MADSLIHNLSSTSTVGNSDYFPVDIYNPNDGLYYTYKVSYVTLQTLLSAGITGTFNSQFTSLQNSINTANSQLTNKVNRSGGDSMNGNYSITGNLSTTGGFETFGTVNVHDQKIVNLGTPSDSYDAATKIYVDNSFFTLTGLIPDVSNKLNITGGAMSGSLSAYADPTNENEVSNKRYVDLKTAPLSNYLPLSGGTMTGGISAGGWRLVNIASPVASTDAATRGYVDAQLGGGNAKYSQTGGTIDGSIDLQSTYYVINALDPQNAYDLSTKNYVDRVLSARDTAIIGRLPLSGGTMSGTLNLGNNSITNVSTPSNGGDAANKTYVDGFLSKSGGTMAGAINLGTYKITSLGDPTDIADAVNKTYVDSLSAATSTAIIGRLPLSGGTMTGFIILNAAPTLGSHPTTKTYVDAINTTLTNTFASYLPLAGGTMAGAINLGTYKITNLGTPTDGTDAATKTYVDTMLPLAGGTITGDINANNTYKITNLPNPSSSGDSANKAYVDTMLPLSGGTMTGSIVLKGFSETVVTNNAANGAVAINLASGNTFKLKLTGNVTGFTVSNIPTGGCSFTVIIEQGTASSYTVVFSINGSGTNPKWTGGTTPTMTSTVNKIDVYSFTTYDGGTTWLGFNGGQNY